MTVSRTAPTPSFTLSGANAAKTRADAVVVGVLTTSKGPVLAPGGAEVAEAYGRKLHPLLSSLGVSGKAGEAVKIPTGGVLNAPLLVLVGLGADPDPVAVRRAAGVAARTVTNAANVALSLPSDDTALVRAAVEGYLLGGYSFDSFKSKPASSASPTDVVVLTTSARRDDFRAACDTAAVVARAVASTRDWVNTPPGDLRPPGFAEAVSDAVKAAGKRQGKGGTKITVTVHDETALRAMGCGGILGVGQASDAPPRLVELSYAPAGATTHLALVGKGITFDSGGLSIKPAQGMTTMKMDMAGAATVVQATLAIAELGLPIKVSTFAPMAENMVSGEALRPGDVLTMYGGRTVEVMNTDAEGRLILADALVRATEVAPDVIVDVATLTGAMVVALGDKVAGVMGSDDVVQNVLAAGERAGEALWPMPLPDEMTERVRASKIADLLQHDWGKWGGGLYAGAFLREFTGELPWAHIDIAGPAFVSNSATGHLTPGGTGFAVATLVQLATDLSA